MQTYYMLGKYSKDSLSDISSARTEECARLVEGLGGELVLMNALLGEYDLALIVRFPNNLDAFKVSLAMNKRMGISFVTYPAIKVSDLDKIATEL